MLSQPIKYNIGLLAINHLYIKCLFLTLKPKIDREIFAKIHIIYCIFISFGCLTFTFVISGQKKSLCYRHFTMYAQLLIENNIYNPLIQIIWLHTSYDTLWNRSDVSTRRNSLSLIDILVELSKAFFFSF